MRSSILSMLCIAVVASACSSSGDASNTMVAGQLTQDDLKEITTELHKHIAVLASDEYEGRGPARKGGELTTAYLEQQFRELGIEPGNGESFFQRVPVTALTTDMNTTLRLEGENLDASLRFGDEMVVGTRRQVETTALKGSPLVFVGYGIVAPERDWNDYADVNVRGKTVVILVNDPGYATQDESMFNGNAMTWYGRWVYKFEEAARQGAAGALIVHETGAASYGWDVVRNGWTGPQISLTAADRNADKSDVIGWLPRDSARTLFKAAGLDYDKQVAAAATPGFRAQPMGDITATVTLNNSVRNSASNNVIGIIPGSTRPQETIIYTAHWDHLGLDPRLEGDQIYNGARDNATGTSALLSLARLYKKLPRSPERSIVFMAVTAEESGLLGSQWYGENPVYPLATTVANINMDGMPVYGPMRDMVVVGYGNSELEDYLRTAVARQKGRYVTRESHPERGGYYRSDHFNFARQGVPALYAESGEDSFNHGREWGARQLQEYTDKRYHTPLDEYDPGWDLSGAALDIIIYFDIGLQLSMESTFPNWYEGNEFKTIRDASASARQ